jgi:replicative DNA helicase
LNALAPASSFDSALPQNLEAEQALLGAILVDNRAFHRIVDRILPEHFFEPLHQRIFEISSELISQGRGASPITVKTYTGDHELEVSVSGPPGLTIMGYMARLCAGAVTVADAPHYATIVYETAMRRRMIGLATDFVGLARDPQVGMRPSQMAAEMVTALDEIASQGLAPTMRRITVGAAARKALAASGETRLGKPSRGLSTGLADLDRVIGGLQRGENSVVAGRPSMGKTGLALQVCLNVAMAGWGVLYFSHEMGDQPLAQRLLASASFDDFLEPPIAYNRIARGLISDKEYARIEAASARVDSVPFLIDPQPGITASQMAARSRQAKIALEAQGVDLSLIVVDHLGLVGSTDRWRGDQNNKIAEIDGNLNAIGRELDCHVMKLSQLNRKCEEREDKRPQLADLRDSGSIEQNADLVIGAFREAYYLERKADLSSEESVRLGHSRNVVELLVLKQRQGETGVVRAFVDMGANAFRDLKK